MVNINTLMNEILEDKGMKEIVYDDNIDVSSLYKKLINDTNALDISLYDFIETMEMNINENKLFLLRFDEISDIEIETFTRDIALSMKFDNFKLKNTIVIINKLQKRSSDEYPLLKVSFLTDIIDKIFKYYNDDIITIIKTKKYNNDTINLNDFEFNNINGPLLNMEQLKYEILKDNMDNALILVPKDCNGIRSRIISYMNPDTIIKNRIDDLINISTSSKNMTIVINGLSDKINFIDKEDIKHIRTILDNNKVIIMENYIHPVFIYLCEKIFKYDKVGNLFIVKKHRILKSSGW